MAATSFISCKHCGLAQSAAGIKYNSDYHKSEEKCTYCGKVQKEERMKLYKFEQTKVVNKIIGAGKEAIILPYGTLIDYQWYDEKGHVYTLIEEPSKDIYATYPNIAFKILGRRESKDITRYAQSVGSEDKSSDSPTLETCDKCLATKLQHLELIRLEITESFILREYAQQFGIMDTDFAAKAWDVYTTDSLFHNKVQSCVSAVMSTVQKYT